MSSRGQVVIPESIRAQLGLEAGTEFVVIAKDEVVVFKRISEPSWDEFDEAVREAKRQAKKAGLKPEHIRQVIQEVRSR